MVRMPRYALSGALVVLGATIALLVASGATGRSQAAPTNTKEPSILYVYPIKIGTVLNGNKGEWSSTTPISYYTTWQRCDTNAQACQKIANVENKATYTVVGADAGHTIRFYVTASNKDGKTTAHSNATSVVPNGPGAPAETAPPKIKGEAVVGKTLTATTGAGRGRSRSRTRSSGSRARAAPRARTTAPAATPMTWPPLTWASGSGSRCWPRTPTGKPRVCPTRPRP